MVQWLGFHARNAGVWVPSLVGELRSHMPHNAAPALKKKKRLRNKFNNKSTRPAHRHTENYEILQKETKD